MKKKNIIIENNYKMKKGGARRLYNTTCNYLSLSKTLVCRLMLVLIIKTGCQETVDVRSTNYERRQKYLSATKLATYVHV